MPVINKISQQKKVGLVLGLVFSINSLPVSAEYYFGVDASKIYERTVYESGTTKINMDSARIKFGRRYQEFGWELQVLAPTDGTGYYNGGAILDKLDIKGGFGVHFTAASPGRGLYGSIGITQMYTEYQELTGSNVGIVDKDNELYFTYTFGGQYKFNKNLGVTLEYTFYHGSYRCSTCIPTGPNPADPEIRLSTINLGMSFSF